LLLLINPHPHVIRYCTALTFIDVFNGVAVFGNGPPHRRGPFLATKFSAIYANLLFF